MNTLIYRSTVVLDCQCDSAVIICVDAALTVSGESFIEGTLVSTAPTGMLTCGSQINAYYLEYDPAQFINPAYILTASEVTGIVCRGCLTQYIDSKEGEPVIPPCENAPVDEGQLLVCSGGVASPLTPTALGQIPVVTDVDAGTVEFQTPALAPCENVPVETGQLLVCVDGTAAPLTLCEVGQVPVVTDAGNCTVAFQTVQVPSDSNGWFGMGYDTSVIIAGSVSMTNDLSYVDCIVNAGEVLSNNSSAAQTWIGSYRLLCSGTLEIEGTISSDGKNGANSFLAGPGPGTIGGGADSCGNTPGGTAVGNNGTHGDRLDSLGKAGSKSGMGGAGGTGGAGGAGGSIGGTGGLAGELRRYDISVLTANFIIMPVEFGTVSPSYVFGGSGGGGGAAGGGGGTNNSGGTGGGGGGGGGFLFIAAKKIILRNTGVLSAIGGNGQAGTNGFTLSGLGNTGGGGGGAGGGGGVIYLIYEEFDDQGGTITVAPGAGAAGGLGTNAGAGGAPGIGGAIGRIVRFNTKLNQFE